ncbi:MAG: HD domain-containing protein [Deinococcales bacterium]
MHDTAVEDTEVTLEQIEQTFGKPVHDIVDGETKIKLKVKDIQDRGTQAENLRRMLLAMVNDMRIILVKLADRLHNMRTLDAMSEDKQKRISTETLEIYAPLANLLGIGELKMNWKI